MTVETRIKHQETIFEFQTERARKNEKCDVCKGKFDSMTIFRNGDTLCANCINGYLAPYSSDFTADYIAENQLDFLDYICKSLQ